MSFRRRIDPTTERYIAGVRMLNAEAYAPPGLGEAAAAATYAGFVACFADALRLGYGVEVPPGTYTISQAIKLDGFAKLIVTGQGKIVFPSADTSLGTDAAYNNDPANKRSALYFEDCEDVEVSDITCEGSQEASINDNRGVAIAAVRTARLRVNNVKQFYGGGLVFQTALTGDESAVVSRCYSYGSRLNSRLGNKAEFVDCHFKLPATVGYDRTEVEGVTYGSSSGIYHFAASGSYLKVRGCTFENYRIDGLKVSGSASALTSFDVSGNSFINCGHDSTGANSGGVGVLIGADDVNPHNQVSVNGNTFTNCAGAIQIYGARAVSVQDNNIYFTATPSVAGTAVVSVARYGTGTQPVESVIVSGNIITAPGGTVGTDVCADAIRIVDVGHGGTNPEAISVYGNMVSNVGEAGISVTNCLAPHIHHNEIVGTTIGIEFDGSRYPWVHGNQIVCQQNNGAQIRGLNSTSWPRVYDNEGAGYLDTFAGKPTLSASGSTAVQFPLLGKSGYVTTADARPEIVFAYGSKWTTGDTVDVNGSVLTYGTHFTTAATLITAIENLANFTCADYGAPWSITTNHLRVRWHTTDNTAGKFYIKTTTTNPLAGVILMNDSVVGDRAKSRGEGPDTDVVIWSPCYKIHSPPVLMPENADAQTAMSASWPLRSTTNAADEQASCTMKIAGLGGTETFTWRL